MIEETVFILDIEKIAPDLLKKINEGKVVLHDGVAYPAPGSGEKGIIKHLPFKETSVQSLQEAINASQSTVQTAVSAAQSAIQTTVVMSSAISTGIILAAMVVQTRYLAGKLDDIQRTVDVISQDIHAHNIIFYMDKITEYLGGVETARMLLNDRSCADEIHDVSYALLSQLASKRNQLLSFIDNILELAKSSSSISAKHYELILRFAHGMLEIIPAGTHIEYLLCARVGKIRLAENILLDGSKKYNSAIGTYQKFINDLHRERVQGRISSDRLDVLKLTEKKAEELIYSKNSGYLLDLPAGRVAIDYKNENSH